MSLNRSQRAATRAELRSNLVLSGLSIEALAGNLGLSAARVGAALDVDGARPEEVWLVRDYLDRVIRSAGTTPTAYSSLSEEKRTAAQAWFSLVDVDDALREASR